MNNHDNRVLHIIYSLNAGGIETFVVNILRNMKNSPIKFDFLVIRDAGVEQFYDEEVIRYGGTILEAGGDQKNKILKYIKSRRDIYRCLKTHPYQIVHIHSGQVDKLPDAVIAKILHVPVVILHSHNQGLSRNVKLYHVRRFLHELLKPAATAIPTHCFACSAAAARWTYTGGRQKVRIIKNGIDIESFRYKDETRSACRQKLGVSNKFVVGHIGRFTYQKNHGLLIDIFYEIQKVNPNAVLLLIGTGELEEAVRNKVRKLGMEQRVMFLGTTDKIPQILQAMDVFLFPSRYEGLPVVGIEVQAAALQAVASDTITGEVAVTDKWHCISLSDPPARWAGEVLKYQEGYERGDNSLQLWQAGYDIKEIARGMEDFYGRQLQTGFCG